MTEPRTLLEAALEFASAPPLLDDNGPIEDGRGVWFVDLIGWSDDTPAAALHALAERLREAP